MVLFLLTQHTLVHFVNGILLLQDPFQPQMFLLTVLCVLIRILIQLIREIFIGKFLVLLLAERWWFPIIKSLIMVIPIACVPVVIVLVLCMLPVRLYFMKQQILSIFILITNPIVVLGMVH